MKKDIYTQVTNKIIAALETNLAPWVKPWKEREEGVMPRNAVSMQHYNGINVLLLWIEETAKGYSAPSWMTFKQAEAKGANVRKGEKGTEIVFYKRINVSNSFTNEATGQTEEMESSIPMLKTFHVFNIDQIENLPEGSFTEEKKENSVMEIPYVATVIRNTGALIREGSDRAFFNPLKDYIAMPAHRAFNSTDDYYATLLHELSHWTGHESRLNRLAAVKRFGDHAYAMEELIAELSSAFLCASLGIDGKLQHANYIASWLKVLSEDKKAIFTAAAKASQASDYILHPQAT